MYEQTFLIKTKASMTYKYEENMHTVSNFIHHNKISWALLKPCVRFSFHNIRCEVVQETICLRYRTVALQTRYRVVRFTLRLKQQPVIHYLYRETRLFLNNEFVCKYLQTLQVCSDVTHTRGLVH